MKVTRFEDPDCWKESRKFVNSVYEATSNGAFRKDARLSGQIQAAATSMMANIINRMNSFESFLASQLTE